MKSYVHESFNEVYVLSVRGFRPVDGVHTGVRFDGLLC